MTELMEKVFQLASELSEDQQNEVAEKLLNEMMASSDLELEEFQIEIDEIKSLFTKLKEKGLVGEIKKTDLDWRNRCAQLLDDIKEDENYIRSKLYSNG